jgi:lipoic acid synthetase
MVGMGEEFDESSRSSTISARSECRSLTIGQYPRPTPKHAPMIRYWHPDEFAELKKIGLAKGFAHVESGPLVRSSYHAHEQADAALLTISERS